MRKEEGRKAQQQRAPTPVNRRPGRPIGGIQAIRHIVRRTPRHCWRLQHIDSSLLLFAYEVNHALLLLLFLLSQAAAALLILVVLQCVFSPYAALIFIASLVSSFSFFVFCNGTAATPTALMHSPVHCQLCSAARSTHLIVGPTPR